MSATRADTSRRAGRRTTLLGAAAVLLLAGLLSGCSGAGATDVPADRSGDGSGIGAWPTFLPSPSASEAEVGSLESPAMAYPGSPVTVQIGSAQALVDVEGPSYPPETKVGAEEVPCTFSVRFREVSAPISMRTASFSVLDGQGGLHALRAAPRTPVPETLEPGRETTLSLVGVLPAGEGLLRYYPTTAGAVAAWDYVAETD